MRPNWDAATSLKYLLDALDRIEPDNRVMVPWTIWQERLATGRKKYFVEAAIQSEHYNLDALGESFDLPTALTNAGFALTGHEDVTKRERLLGLRKLAAQRTTEHLNRALNTVPTGPGHGVQGPTGAGDSRLPDDPFVGKPRCSRSHCVDRKLHAVHPMQDLAAAA